MGGCWGNSNMIINIGQLSRLNWTRAINIKRIDLWLGYYYCAASNGMDMK